GVVAQRLVRRVCDRCAAPDELDDVLRHRFHLPADAGGFVRGQGCGRCGQTGYRGRLGIYELLQMSPELQGLVETGASTNRLRDCAMRAGMRPMWHDGLEKAQLGQTSLDEVAKAASIVQLEPVADDDGR